MVSKPGISLVLIPLAEVDFSEYDPLGGQGGVEEMPGGQENLVPESIPMMTPEPEAEPEPEPELENQDLSVVESISEVAEPLPPPAPPPPKEKPKPKKKTTTKPPATNPTNSAQAVNDLPGSGLPVGTGGSGPGGTKGGTGIGNPNAFNAYKAKIRKKLERNKKYPPSARSRKITGIVKVSFVIIRDGSIHSPKLVESSGEQILDDEAITLLSRVSPLPPIPESITGENLQLTVPIQFSIK
jgi:TonB family protein